MTTEKQHQDEQLISLMEHVNECERQLAPGSETILLGQCIERMRQLTGVNATAWREIDPSVMVPGYEAAWWRAAYELYEADPENYEHDKVTA